MHTQLSLVRNNDAGFPVGLAATRDRAPATLRSLFRAQPMERLEQGQALCWQGEPAGHVFEIVSGGLRTVRILSDGRRIITGFLFAGDVVGAGARNRCLTTVEAIAPTPVRRLARRRFDEEIDRSAALRSQLMAQLSEEMSAAQDQVVLLARKTAEERVASFLLALMRRAQRHNPSSAVVDLPMTRLDMADYLGITIETVSRVLTRLAGRGVIAPAGRHEITVRRPVALAELAVDDDADALDDLGVVWAS